MESIRLTASSYGVTDLSEENKEKLEVHLKSDDFFGAENNPTSKLVITSVAKNENGTYGVVGDLTIKNITQPLKFDLAYKFNNG